MAAATAILFTEDRREQEYPSQREERTAYVNNNCLPRDQNRRHAFELLSIFYESYQRDVMAYALYFTRHEEDALDAVQETFCLAMENLNQTNEKIDNPRAWLMRIARNTLLRRRERARQEALIWKIKANEDVRITNFTVSVLNGMLAENVTDFIRREFTPILQEIFILRHFHELNLAEIAEIIQIPTTSVHRMLASVTNQVQQKFAGIGG